ncbi:MAG: hypothetical protein V3S16_00570, partial [Candidatus Desulfatibia sp.]
PFNGRFCGIFPRIWARSYNFDYFVNAVRHGTLQEKIYLNDSSTIDAYNLPYCPKQSDKYSSHIPP